MLPIRHWFVLINACASLMLVTSSCNESDTPSGGGTKAAGSTIASACELFTEQDVATGLGAAVDTTVSRKEFGTLFCQHSVNSFSAWSSIQMRTDYSLQEYGRSGARTARNFWDNLLLSYRNSKVRTVSDTSYYSQPSELVGEMLVEEIKGLGEGAFFLYTGDSPMHLQLWVYSKYAVFSITTVPINNSLTASKSLSLALARVVVERL